MKRYAKWITTPIGRLQLIADENAITALLWDREQRPRMVAGELQASEKQPLLSQAEQQLDEYFAGTRTDFSVPLAPKGTDFQQKVWEKLCGIPYGKTISYGSLARALGDVKLTRAVGAASGRNPVSILIPCHRVVGVTGSLTGFAGGLDAKRFLLNLERGELELRHSERGGNLFQATN